MRKDSGMMWGYGGAQFTSEMNVLGRKWELDQDQKNQGIKKKEEEGNRGEGNETPPLHKTHKLMQFFQFSYTCNILGILNKAILP